MKINLFQFHKGTIKTTFHESKRLLFILFQFHKGTIKTRITYQWLHGSLFQFHKGTIKTCSHPHLSRNVF